ncbi:hypothetical protein PG995_010661 [Apiospora arundinis]
MIGDYAPAEPGKALYVIWARDSEDEKEVRFIDGQLEEIAGPENVYVEVYPTQVYFWRAFLTPSQSEILKKMPEVWITANRTVATVALDKIANNPLQVATIGTDYSYYGIGKKNQDISRKKPPPGRKLYHVECRDRYAEEGLRRVADALEGMAGALNMYTNTSGGGVWYWDAFLTDADVEQVLRMEETCNVFAYKPTDESGHEYDPTDC